MRSGEAFSSDSIASVPAAPPVGRKYASFPHDSRRTILSPSQTLPLSSSHAPKGLSAFESEPVEKLVQVEPQSY
jgi:hypothetical protein